jgi:hypothetical protein
MNIQPPTLTPTLIFISHDSRDSEIAEAFCDLVEKASLGILQTFCSSDRKGERGIDYGARWYQKIMEKLESAAVVICLLTRRSINRPWVLYEAGVATGKLNTPVQGLVLGISLGEANQGPFAQLQNCSDDVDSVTTFIVKLITRLLPGAKPDRDMIRSQVEQFIQSVAPQLEQTGIPDEKEESKFEQGSFTSLTARMLEEIKEIAGSLPLRLEERLPKQDILEMIQNLKEAIEAADKAKDVTAETLKEDSKALHTGIEEIRSLVETNLKKIPAISSLIKCGILNIHEDRPSAEDHLIELLIKAKEHIEIVGISLRTLFQGGGKLNRTILNLLTDASENKKQKPRWRVMVLDPGCEQARYRSEREEPPGKKMEDGNLFREVNLTIKVVEEWKSKGCSIELRAYKGSPSCFLMIIDNIIFVEQYHYGRAGGARVAELVPLLEFSSDSNTYRELLGHFDYMWEKLSRDTDTFDSRKTEIAGDR